MNARIVNLRTRRKQKLRNEKRHASGGGPAPSVDKAERERAMAENRRERDRLEGHRRDDDA